MANPNPFNETVDTRILREILEELQKIRRQLGTLDEIHTRLQQDPVAIDKRLKAIEKGVDRLGGVLKA